MENINSNLFVDVYKKRPIIVDRGEGSYLLAVDGKRYLDFLSGISINNLGYSDSGIQQRIIEQLRKVIHPSNYYYTQVQIALAERLTKASGLDRVFFANGGTEANEAALSFISAYSKTVQKKNEIIVFEGSFFGRTYGSQMMTTGGTFRDIKFVKVPFNDDEKFKNAVTESTLGVSLELVLGHGGIRKMNSAVIESIKSICKEKNIIILVDEVQTGLGRAGYIFAFQESDIHPDIVTLGKSLGGGLPLSAVLVSDRIAQTVHPGDYGCTMGGNSLACAAGIGVMDFLLKKENIDEIRQKGEYILKKLQVLAEQYPSEIINARCYGLMCALEVREGLSNSVVVSCVKQGLLVDTVNKNVLRMLPPFTVSYNEIDSAISILETAIKQNL